MKHERITLYAGPADGDSFDIDRGATHHRVPLPDPNRRPPHIAIYARCPILTLQAGGEPIFRHVPNPHPEDLKA